MIAVAALAAGAAVHTGSAIVQLAAVAAGAAVGKRLVADGALSGGTGGP
jgi:hypothetical protein